MSNAIVVQNGIVVHKSCLDTWHVHGTLDPNHELLDGVDANDILALIMGMRLSMMTLRGMLRSGLRCLYSGSLISLWTLFANL